jgi:hypothetical protein
MYADRIAFASTARLDARIQELEDMGDLDAMANGETFPGEYSRIEKELEARYYADHSDARVRQGMGAE